MAAEAIPTWTSTMRALLSPRRLVPVVFLAVPLLVAQWRFSPYDLAALVGLVMVGGFWFVAPHAWRVLFAEREHQSPTAARLAAFVVIAFILVMVGGYVLPHALRMGLTLLTDRFSLAIAFALFVVGGWGLGRDIEMEKSLTHAQTRAEMLAREAERAQLLALRSHLDPHFLFNTLNAIAEWCREDGEVAERATLELSSMLRAILDGVRRRDWPLSKELELLDTLLDLHLIRDPELFTLVRHVPDPVPELGVPPMIFLPIVENAVKHGPAKGHRGELLLEVEVKGETLRFVVENPGPYAGRRDGGEGIAMVERRLSLAYGERASLEIEGVAEDRTRVEIVMLGLPESSA
jgi:sensor histidine kinase YesM